jgi:hypothetical protein
MLHCANSDPEDFYYYWPKHVGELIIYVLISSSAISGGKYMLKPLFFGYYTKATIMLNHSKSCLYTHHIYAHTPHTRTHHTHAHTTHHTHTTYHTTPTHTHTTHHTPHTHPTHTTYHTTPHTHTTHHTNTHTHTHVQIF